MSLPTAFLVAFFVAARVLAPAQSEEPATLTPEQRQINLQSFEHVWKTIRDQHWDPKLGGLDWQAIHDELRPKMEQAGAMPEARAALLDMIGRLHQTHFGIIASELYQDIDPKTGRRSEEEGATGMDVRVIGGQALVTSVDEGSPAATKGVRPGWQILKIGEADPAPVLSKVEETYKVSTLLGIMQMRAVTSRLDGKLGDPVRVTFLDGNNKTLELEIQRGKPKGVKTKFGFLPARYVWMDSRQLDGNVGYIGFNIFLDPPRLMQFFEDAVRGDMQADGIIVDLRGNPGGIGVMAMGMAGWFIEGADRKLGTMYTRQAPLQFVINPRLETYHGPLAILVDGASGSTSEVFAGGLKDLGRARIFGTRTAGAALPSVFERLPNGDGFQYAIANYISEGGKPLEGIGVIPDVEVSLSRESLLAGGDPVLGAAKDWIHRKSKEKP